MEASSTRVDPADTQARDRQIARLFQYFDAANDMAVQSAAFYEFTKDSVHQTLATKYEQYAKILKDEIMRITNDVDVNRKPNPHWNIGVRLPADAIPGDLNLAAAPTAPLTTDNVAANVAPVAASVAPVAASVAPVAASVAPASANVAPVAANVAPVSNARVGTTQWKIPSNAWKPKLSSPLAAAADPPSITHEQRIDHIITSIENASSELVRPPVISEPIVVGGAASSLVTSVAPLSTVDRSISSCRHLVSPSCS